MQQYIIGDSWKLNLYVSTGPDLTTYSATWGMKRTPVDGLTYAFGPISCTTDSSGTVSATAVPSETALVSPAIYFEEVLIEKSGEAYRYQRQCNVVGRVIE